MPSYYERNKEKIKQYQRQYQKEKRERQWRKRNMEIVARQLADGHKCKECIFLSFSVLGKYKCNNPLCIRLRTPHPDNDACPYYQFNPKRKKNKAV